jgi:hypothetical protein
MPTYSEDDEYEDELPPSRTIDRLPMGVHKRPAGYPRPYNVMPYKARPHSPVRSISAVIGGVLLLLAIVGFAWFWNYRQVPSVLPGWTQGQAPTVTPTINRGATEQAPALAAAGITLERPTETPSRLIDALLSQQQALLIASQLEPEAAANAQSTTSQFVLISTGVINHAPTSNASAQPRLRHVPAWMILYQGIPLQPNDPSADPTPYPHASHNLYVFLNATTGKELLAIWV